jgi:hypothetical protein
MPGCIEFLAQWIKGFFNLFKRYGKILHVPGNPDKENFFNRIDMFIQVKYVSPSFKNEM